MFPRHHSCCKQFLSMLNTTALTHPSLYHQVDWRVMSSTRNGTTSLLSHQWGPYLALSNLLPIATHLLHSLVTNPHWTLLYITQVAILSYQPCLRLFLLICINKLCNGTIPYTFNQSPIPHFQSLMSNSSEPNKTEGPLFRSIACFNWKGLMVVVISITFFILKKIWAATVSHNKSVSRDDTVFFWYKKYNKNDNYLWKTVGYYIMFYM